jgi:hypothetical protein
MEQNGTQMKGQEQNGTTTPACGHPSKGGELEQDGSKFSFVRLIN